MIHAKAGWVMALKPIRREGFRCRRCGHCCLDLADAACHAADPADVRRWKRAGEARILDRLEEVLPGSGMYDMWFSPTTGDELHRCPWLRKAQGKAEYTCMIQDTKPSHCHQFPRSIEHAKDCGCPGWDATS